MRVPRREFRRLVHQAFDQLPPQFRDSLDNVAIVVEDWPAKEDLDQVATEAPDELFGLYVGVPLAERSDGQPLIPDKIVLFRRPIQEACRSRDEMVREIRVTLLHEVGHFLGMAEEELERLGYG